MTLFDELEPPAAPPLKGTIAADRGDAKATMCANCGLTAYVPTAGEWKATTKLGACPRCGGAVWLRQSLPVACFGADTLRQAGDVIQDRPESQWCRQYEETFDIWEELGGVPADLSTVEALVQMALTLWREHKALKASLEEVLA